jgi:hypothetical protein
MCGAWAIGGSAPTRAGAEPERPAAVDRTQGEGLHPVAPREEGRHHPGTPGASSGGWWIGTVGIALALAAFGGISLASRRWVPQAPAGALQVVGRASLSAKHTVYLLRANNRILIIGAGSQGPPTLLGEWAEPDPAGPRIGGEA